MSRARKLTIAILALLAAAAAGLAAYGRWLSENHYYLEGSPYSPHELVARLRAGELAPGVRDWAPPAKERELYRCGGRPEDGWRVVRCSVGKDTWYEIDFPEYRFEYARYEDREASYSLFADDGALFAVYEWSKDSETGRFHFQDEARMQEYLVALETTVARGRAPLTYAVPEPLRDRYASDVSRRHTVRVPVEGEEALRAARAAGLETDAR